MGAVKEWFRSEGYEPSVEAHELASHLGGVEENELACIEHALRRAYEAGRKGMELI